MIHRCTERRPKCAEKQAPNARTGEIPERGLNEIEASNLPDTELKGQDDLIPKPDRNT